MKSIRSAEIISGCEEGIGEKICENDDEVEFCPRDCQHPVVEIQGAKKSEPLSRDVEAPIPIEESFLALLCDAAA